jgi:cytochrome c biogenesis protein CcmG/thiol:disulfide interchange protein DsbE
MRTFLLWLPFFLLLVFVAVLVQRTTHLSFAIVTPINNKPMPRLALPMLAGSDTLTGEMVKGKPALVNFFASWCGPCAMENAVLVKLAAQKQIEIDGIALKDQPAPLQSYLAARGNPYAHIGMDATGRTAIEWGVSGVPETFAVNAAGVVKGHHTGSLSAEDAAALVKIATEPVPATEPTQ